MTTSHFARIPQYNPTHQCPVTPIYTQEDPWGQGHASPRPLNNGTLQGSDLEDQECVITNGYGSLSPLTSPVDSDHPDTPGIFRTQSFDMTVFDIRKVPPEQIAAQITLIDLEIFKAIGMEEFSSCNWTKKDKQRLSPNIVAFTRRFNHTTFLVMREILNEENEKARGEILSQFIKIAKKLFEFNNLHSLKAVVSGLQSTPIYRLSQTWKHVTKKDRSSFDKLAEFLSDNDNRKLLREHMDEAKLPCIPHLGLYLTDLCFLFDVPNKGPQVESTLNMIAYCQNSTYDTFIVEPHVRKYLTHVRYIDELQKFFEDDNYKLSLKYEPSKTPDLKKRHTEHNISPSSSTKSKLRTSKSHEDLLSQLAAEAQDDSDMGLSSNLRNSFLRRSFNTTMTSRQGSPGPPDMSMSKLASHKLSVPGLNKSGKEQQFASASVEVRKTTTLPNSFKDANLLKPSSGHSKPRSASDRGTPGKKRGESRGASNTPSTSGASGPSAPFPPSPRVHTKSHSAGSTALASMFGVAKSSHPDIRGDHSPEPLPPTSLSLLDDSLLDDTFPFTPTSSTGNASTSGGSSSHVSLEDFSEGDQLYSRQAAELEDLPGNMHSWRDIIKDGVLKRKNLKVNGHPVSQLLRGHPKCYVQLTSNSIVFMPKDAKKQAKPGKVVSVMLKACRLKHRDRSEKLKEEQFIVDDDDGNSTRFTAKSVSGAMEWVVAIKEAMRVQEEREREEAERSLIKL